VWQRFSSYSIMAMFLKSVEFVKYFLISSFTETTVLGIIAQVTNVEPVGSRYFVGLLCSRAKHVALANHMLVAHRGVWSSLSQ
jgi:hypothetical protein